MSPSLRISDFTDRRRRSRSLSKIEQIRRYLSIPTHVKDVIEIGAEVLTVNLDTLPPSEFHSIQSRTGGASADTCTRNLAHTPAQRPPANRCNDYETF